MTVYVPAVDSDGVIEPVLILMDNPAGVELNVPPNVPVLTTGCAVVNVLQYGLPL